MPDEVKLKESELEEATGGQNGWQYAKGNYVSYGNRIVYTIAGGDTLPGIAIRFGVTVTQIQQWNGIRNPNAISVGQKLTIYPAIVR